MEREALLSRMNGMTRREQILRVQQIGRTYEFGWLIDGINP